MITSDEIQNIKQNKRQERILKRLNHTLTYENATIIAFAAFGMVGYAILLMILSFIAIGYSTYLVKTLYTLNKTKWLIAFFIMVFSPLILKLILSKTIVLDIILPTISLFMFYLFCWILKFYVSKWLEDIKYAGENFDE